MRQRTAPTRKSFKLAGQWEVCLDVASALTQIEPDRRFGWLRRAQCLQKLGRTAEAKVVLLSVLGRFDPDCTFRFNLACYSAQLGQLSEARAWLERVIKAANDGEKLRRLRLRALNEPELATLWREISKDS